MRSHYRLFAYTILMFLISTVTACGTSPTANNTSATADTTTTTEESAADTTTTTEEPAVEIKDQFSTEMVAQQLRDEGAVLNLYWPAGGTIKTWINDTLVPGYQDFVRETYGVDIEVNILATGGGDQDFFQKLSAYQEANPDGNDFDIDVVRVVPSVDLVMAGENGWMLPILPNYAELLPNLAHVNQPGLESFTIAGETYAIPVYQPTISFFYNEEQISEPPQTLDALLDWARENPRRFTYEDPRAGSGIGSGTMFLLTTMQTFGDIEAPETYEPGFEYLNQLQEYVYPQPAEAAQMLELMERGEIWLMAFWNDWGLSAARDQNITFMKNYFPEEGTPVRNTPIAVPRAAAHPTAAILLTDYTLSDEVQRELALLTQQIPASVSEGVWDGLSSDTFGYDFDYIQNRTFAAFNSRDNLEGLQTMVDTFSTEVLDK